MLNKIMEELTARRMMSVGNLAQLMEMEPEELQPRLDQLEAGGRIRYAISNCSGSCSTCSSCSDGACDDAPAQPAVNPAAIVISLERRGDAE